MDKEKLFSMKNYIWQAIILLILFFAFGMIFRMLFYKNMAVNCPPDGHVIVSQSFLDSLKNEKTDTIVIIRDSIIYRDTITYHSNNNPQETQNNDTVPFGDVKVYIDSIKNDTVNIWSKMWVNGELERVDIWYKPFIHYREKIVEIIKPTPVPYNVPVPQTGLYLIGGAGTNFDKITLSIGGMMIDKKDRTYGLEYLRFGSSNIYQFKYGFKIISKK